MSSFKLSQSNRAAVLAAFYNHADPPRYMGAYQAHQADKAPLIMTLPQAKKLIKRGSSFVYLYGRDLYLDLSGETLDTSQFDRIHGEGTGQAILTRLQTTGEITPPVEPDLEKWFETIRSGAMERLEATDHLGALYHVAVLAARHPSTEDYTSRVAFMRKLGLTIMSTRMLGNEALEQFMHDWRAQLGLST